MEEAKLIKAIEHYQKNLERYLSKCEDAKILHCIERLSSLPIEVTHLQKTGVGRTVNGLRKLGNEVGEAARTLVTKWKDMVAQDGDESEAQEKHNSSHSSEDYSENDSQSSRCEQDEDMSRRHEKEKSRKHDKKRHDDKKRDDSKRCKDDKEESKRRELEENKRKEELKRRDEKEELRRREEKEEMKRKEDKEQQEQRRKEEKDEKRKKDEKEESRKKADDSSKNGIKRKRDEDMNDHIKHKKSSDESSKTSKSSSASASSSSSSKRKRSSDESNHKSKDEKKRKSSSSDKKEKESSSGSAKKKVVAADDGIDCESGTSFADALMMHTPSVKVTSSKKSLSSSFASISATKSSTVQKSTSKVEPAPSLIAFPIAPLPEKLETQDISIATMLPSITTNYKPLGNTFRELDLNSKARKVQDDEALSRLMYAKNQRTKVYSGNKAAFSKMPSLFEMCTRILQDNIEALEYTGGVPYAILKPVLEKATPDQLFSLEYHNPYIIDDSDELWSFHCQKEFRGKKRQEMETCRDMYMRCLNERETKLKALTANIKLSQDKSLPVRQTKLAYVDSVVKPPRNVAKKQFKNGVDNNKKPMITPSSRLNAIATAGSAGQVSVPNHVTVRSSSSASSSYSKPQKKAPLMAKTLQLMKGRFRR